MCLRVCATLCGGCPRVDMVDEATGAVRYRWCPDVPVREVDSAALHELMRLLLLASAVNAMEQEGAEPAPDASPGASSAGGAQPHARHRIDMVDA